MAKFQFDSDKMTEEDFNEEIIKNLKRPVLRAGDTLYVSEISPLVSAKRYADGFVEIYWGDVQIGTPDIAGQVGKALASMAATHQLPAPWRA